MVRFQMGEAEMIKKTICNMCLLRCGIDVHIKNGKIAEVTAMREHPFNTLCSKVEGMIEWVYSPERITSPLRKASGKWRNIPWEEAFEFLSQRLIDIKEKHGAKSLVIYSGIAFAGTHDVRAVARRFCDLYGTPNLTTGGSFCHRAHVIGHSLTLDYEPIELASDFAKANCIINWGRNPEESRHIAALQIEVAKRRGAKLIVIDPRRTATAKKADIHAQIKPGTDCALALGMLNVIIGEGLYDESFVKNWTVGFDRLAEHVTEYSLEKVAEITWIPTDMIKELARAYATIKPATIFQYISLDHSTNGVQTSRAIAILMSITGNFDIRGGNRVCPRLKTANLSIKDLAHVSEDSISPQYPLFNKFTGYPTASPLIEAILSEKPYPIKALIVQGANPALTWPNSNKVKQALARLDLLAVHDFFMTETANMADIFLPACTFLERKNLFVYNIAGQLPLVVRSEPVIEPLGDCMEDWRMWPELGRKMGYREYFPWEHADEVFQAYLEPSGITIDQLKQHPEGIIYSQWEEKSYLKKGFNTPSGKVEIYSSLLGKYGYDPLPTYNEPPQGPISTRDLAKDYPLILTTGPRVNMFTHSQYRNVSSLRRKMPEPLIEINIETAKGLGITDGDMVKLESPRGEIKLKAKVTDDIHCQVVCIQHGWDEANANLLTDNMDRDPISGFPAFRSVLCRVTRQKGS